MKYFRCDNTVQHPTIEKKATTAQKPLRHHAPHISALTKKKKTTQQINLQSIMCLTFLLSLTVPIVFLGWSLPRQACKAPVPRMKEELSQQTCHRGVNEADFNGTKSEDPVITSLNGFSPHNLQPLQQYREVCDMIHWMLYFDHYIFPAANCWTWPNRG